MNAVRFTAVLSLVGLVAAAPLLLGAKGSGYHISGTVTNEATGTGVLGVDVSAFDGDGTLVDVARTDATGQYVLDLPGPGGTYRIEFARRDFLPGDSLSGVAEGTTNADTTLTPVSAGTAPAPPIAYSGPNRIYVEWQGAAEYNFSHYTLRRVETDATGAPVGDPVAVGGDLVSTEFEDEDVTAGANYAYTVSSVNAIGAVSPESEPSVPVEAKVIEVFFPHIAVNPEVESTYLWMRDARKQEDATLRIPIAVRSAYEIDVAGVDIRGMLPNDLVIADTQADIEVRTTGITDGMFYLANAIAGELLIASSTSMGRELYGSGTLFDVYVKPRPDADCPESVNLVLFEDGANPGVRLWDGGSPPELYDVRLISGSLCFFDEDCAQGDVNNDGNINLADVEYLLDLVTGAVAPNACSDFAGDINLDGRVDAADATQLRRWLEDLPLNPDAAKSAAEAPSYALYPKQTPPEVRLGDPDSDQATGKVSFPVYMDSAAELPLAGFTLSIAFPAGENGLVFEAVEPGSVLEGHVVRSRQKESDGYGSVHITASAPEAMATKGQTELLRVGFRLGYDGFFDHWRPVIITSFASNDPYGHTPRHGAPGQPILVTANGIVASSLFCEVLNDDSGAPVSNATITLNPSPAPPLDEREAGIYPFPAVLAGSYTATAVAPGFESRSQVVTIAERETRTLTLRLQSSGSEGEGEGEGEPKTTSCAVSGEANAAPRAADLLSMAALLSVLICAGRPARIGRGVKP